jgi:RNA polymerase sigma-70 factor (ECF subfamily)
MEGEVETALAGLQGEFREALLLVDVEELSYQEVSGVLNIPIGTVKSRVSRGRAILRDALTSFAKARGIIRS